MTIPLPAPGADRDALLADIKAAASSSHTGGMLRVIDSDLHVRMLYTGEEVNPKYVVVPNTDDLLAAGAAKHASAEDFDLDDVDPEQPILCAVKGHVFAGYEKDANWYLYAGRRIALTRDDRGGLRVRVVLDEVKQVGDRMRVVFSCNCVKTDVENVAFFLR
jgi:hypothetical protein